MLKLLYKKLFFLIIWMVIMHVTICFVCTLKRNNNTTFVIFCDNIKMVRLIPQDIANQIIGMAAAGATQGAIAARYGVHRNSVRNILRRHALTGNTRHRPITGRPRVTTPAQDRYIRTAHLR